MAKSTSALSVVIPSHRNYEGLGRVLDGFGAQTAESDSFEVIVAIDHADPDPAAARAAIGERSYPFQVLRGEIPGASANRNAGWRAAASPLVLFTDNDTLPAPELVAEHLSWHERHPQEQVGVLGHVRWTRELSMSPFMHWLDHGVQFDYPNIDGIEAGWGRFYTSNVSVKRSLIERVGGFDERRLPYGYEDLDFAYRAEGEGLRLLYNRRAVVEHLREVDLESFKEQMARIARAERVFTDKHPELDPYFFRMFSHAVGLERARGRGRHLIRFVPRGLPVIGEWAWTSADLYYRQQLGPAFLDAWEAAAPP